jgi:hypothetical protein
MAMWRSLLAMTNSLLSVSGNISRRHVAGQHAVLSVMRQQQT